MKTIWPLSFMKSGSQRNGTGLKNTVKMWVIVAEQKKRAEMATHRISPLHAFIFPYEHFIAKWCF